MQCEEPNTIDNGQGEMSGGVTREMDKRAKVKAKVTPLQESRNTSRLRTLRPFSINRIPKLLIFNPEIRPTSDKTAGANSRRMEALKRVSAAVGVTVNELMRSIQKYTTQHVARLRHLLRNTGGDEAHALQLAAPLLARAERVLRLMPRARAAERLAPPAPAAPPPAPLLARLVQAARAARDLSTHAVCGPLARPDLRRAWQQAVRLARRRLAALAAVGDDAGAMAEGARPTPADWPLLDVVLLYDACVHGAGAGVAAAGAGAALLQLVQRHRLERADVGAGAWRAAAREYCARGRVASPVLLQRRWHELKARAWQVVVRRAGPVYQLHVEVARAYPHVLHAEPRSWTDLVAAGLVYEGEPAPGGEGEGREEPAPPPDHPASDDDDLVLIEREVETLEISDEEEGERDEASGGRERIVHALKQELQSQLREMGASPRTLGDEEKEEDEPEAKLDMKLAMDARVMVSRVTDDPRWGEAARAGRVDLRRLGVRPARARLMFESDDEGEGEGEDERRGGKRVRLPDMEQERRRRRRRGHLTAQVAPSPAPLPPDLHAALRGAEARVAAESRRFCCAALRERAVNEARRRIAERARRLPPAPVPLHARSCRPPCRCCCAGAERGQAAARLAGELRALHRAFAALQPRPADPAPGTPPRPRADYPPRKTAPSSKRIKRRKRGGDDSSDSPQEETDPLKEWIRQKNLVSRFFDLNLKKPKPRAKVSAKENRPIHSTASAPPSAPVIPSGPTSVPTRAPGPAPAQGPVSSSAFSLAEAPSPAPAPAVTPVISPTPAGQAPAAPAPAATPVLRSGCSATLLTSPPISGVLSVGPRPTTPTVVSPPTETAERQPRPAPPLIRIGPPSPGDNELHVTRVIAGGGGEKQSAPSTFVAQVLDVNAPGLYVDEETLSTAEYVCTAGAACLRLERGAAPWSPMPGYYLVTDAVEVFAHPELWSLGAAPRRLAGRRDPRMVVTASGVFRRLCTAPPALTRQLSGVRSAREAKRLIKRAAKLYALHCASGAFTPVHVWPKGPGQFAAQCTVNPFAQRLASSLNDLTTTPVSICIPSDDEE